MSALPPSHPKRRARRAAAVDAWNKRHEPGAPVLYWGGIREGKGKPGTTKGAAFILSGHTAGVMIQGVGFVALSHVEAAP